jgi:hypothetical protein
MKPCLAALALLAAAPMATHGEGVRATFTVSANVPARANLKAISQPRTISVSDEDITRGFVDVAAVYSVTNNDPAGYLLRFAPLAGLTSSIEVSGLDTAVSMAEETVEVVQPPALRPRGLGLSFRFVLDPAVPAGVYPLPLQVSVTTL